MKPKTPTSKTLAELKRMKARLSNTKQPLIMEAEAIRRIRVAEARRLELKLKRETGELVELKQFSAMLSNFVSNAKSRLLGIGNKLAPELAIETEEAKIKAAIDEEIREALTELSRWDPEARPTEVA